MFEQFEFPGKEGSPPNGVDSKDQRHDPHSQTPKDTTTEPENEKQTSPTGKTNPFSATVEDCPEEDVVLLDKPSSSPASPATTTTATEKATDARNTTEKRTSVQDPNCLPEIHVEAYTPQEQSQPQALRYLDADSPVVTPEAIRRSVSNGSSTFNLNGHHIGSPSILSRSSVPTSYFNNPFSQKNRNEPSYHTWSPDHVAPEASTNRNNPFSNFTKPNHESKILNGASQVPAAWPGSPETGYGNAHTNATPFTAHATPLPPFLGHNMAPPQQPHMQRPPITGYQLLAMKLAGSIFGYPNVTPIYRRFEALNHRLLLQLQDELAELEQQLENIDIADTQSRVGPMGVLPASRRSENLNQGELGWQKQDILGKIGWKLAQYNKLISSFKESQYLPAPSIMEIEDYRAYLRHEQAIADPETRFLDDHRDLVSLSPIDWEESPTAAADIERTGDPTPTPQVPAFVATTPALKTKPAMDPVRARTPRPRTPRPRTPRAVSRQPPPPPASRSRSRSPKNPMYLVYAVIVAIVVPILTFLVIPAFLERMVVVFLVFSGVAMAVVQAGSLTGLAGMMDYVLCAGVYGGLMAVVASTIS